MKWHLIQEASVLGRSASSSSVLPRRDVCVPSNVLCSQLPPSRLHVYVVTFFHFSVKALDYLVGQLSKGTIGGNEEL